MDRLTFSSLSKSYGDIPALSDVTLTLRGGRTHALMGENGAGKSTLIKLIAGVVRADSLSVKKDESEITLANPQDATDAGFRFIHQELNIIPQISVAENILIGHPLPRRFGPLVNWAAVRAQARKALDALGAGHIDVDLNAGELPAGDQMLMRIASALALGERADLYVFDEPTAALTATEAESLFDVITRLKTQGAAILYVSHRIDEVIQICDDITILRNGQRVSTGPVAHTSKSAIIHAMTGRDVVDAYPPHIGGITKTPVVKVRHGASAALSDLNFELNAGEIVGVTGLAASGQSQLLKLFLGLEPLTSGIGEISGRPLPRNPAQAWSRSIAYIPSERRAQALMLNSSIRANMVAPHLSGYGLRAKRRLETNDTLAMAERVQLKSRGTEQPVKQLSGGNQQKVVFARALMGDPKLLLLDEPTRGVDVGAKYEIYRLIREASGQGCTVILSSSDLPEILGLCDRIIVLQSGRQAYMLDRGTLSSADLLAHFYPAHAAMALQ